MALTDKLTAIADAIRAKTGKEDALTLDQMPTEIAGITTGGGGGSAEGCVTVTFMYGDVELFSRPVYIGDDCPEPVAQGRFDAPTKESTAQYNYTFYGWGASDGGAADANILKNITEDKTVYAIFTATARLYTITFYDEDGTTVLATKQVPYGTVPSYTPTKDGVLFGGWAPDPVAVTGDASYTVVWASELANGTFTKNIQWKLMTNGDLYISGSGDMPEYKTVNMSGISGTYYEKSPIYSYASKIKKVVIENGITSIGNNTFYNAYTSIKSVEIADSVTSIGNGAFSGCKALAEINIPNGVTTLGNSPFSNNAITSITIPSSITQIGSQCFFNCTSLVSVTLQDGLTTIGVEMFRQCSALPEINIPSTVTTIGSSAFSTCTALTRAIFESTSGWASGSTEISATDLADPATAATYLTKTYKSEWTRS